MKLLIQVILAYYYIILLKGKVSQGNLVRLHSVLSGKGIAEVTIRRHHEIAAQTYTTRIVDFRPVVIVQQRLSNGLFNQNRISLVARAFADILHQRVIEPFGQIREGNGIASRAKALVKLI